MRNNLLEFSPENDQEMQDCRVASLEVIAAAPGGVAERGY
jgi:hypothetical protein